jgi:hypothetical protein
MSHRACVPILAALLGACNAAVTQDGNTPDSGDAGTGHDSGVATPDGGRVSPDAGSRPDAGFPADAGSPGTLGQSLVWVWYNYSTVLPDVAQHPGTFTHVSPALYDVNYAYASGVPEFYGGSDNFDGLTSAQVVQQIHAAGLKCVPLIYGGKDNDGTDQGIQNILNDSPAGAQSSFIAGLVSEGMAKGYDGWNLDWEVDTSGTDYTGYGSKLETFLGALKSALHAQGMTLSIDLGTWFIRQTYCSGGDGMVDLTQLGANVDLAILEDYAATLTGGSMSCPSSLPNPQSCPSPDEFVTDMNLMCVYLPPEVVSIGLDANATASNPIAGETISRLESYGIKNVAMWPDYNTNGPGGSYVFMDTQQISPSNANWYQLLSGFLAHYPP